MLTCPEKVSGLSSSVSNFVEMISHRGNQQPVKKAFRYLSNGGEETSTLSYGDLDTRSRAIAAKLQSMTSIGDRALLLYPPGLDFITAFFGCLYAGVIAVPAYPPKPNRGLDKQQAIIDACQADLVLTTASVMSVVSRQAKQSPLSMQTLHWLTTEDIDESWAEEWAPFTIDDNTLAFLQYTSGSTGRPKGVMVSHRNLMFNSATINQCFQDTSDSVGVSWLPPYHDMGLIGGILQPIYVGATMVIMPPMAFLYKPLCWLEAISRYGATTSGGPNFAYDLCVEKIATEQKQNLDLSRWEVAFTGAEPVRSQTLKHFSEAFHSSGFRRQSFYPCYGMAETTLLVSGGFKASPPVLCSTVGDALGQDRVIIADKGETGACVLVGCGHSHSGTDVIVVDPKSLKRCKPEEIGEIWVKGPSVAQGYWNRETETAQAFNVYTEDTQEGPFLRTGDLGFLQQDELFITGRLKDLIIVRGCNHYPQDIELTVESSHPALRAGCGAAFTVDIKGKESLVIVQEVKRSYLRQLKTTEVVTAMQQHVAQNHSLHFYAAVLIRPGSIPKTSSGKVKRYACRAMFLNNSLRVITDWSENPKHTSGFNRLRSDVDSTLARLQACNRY